MSRRHDLRAALVAKLAALPAVVAAGATVEVWRGDPEAFNLAAAGGYLGVRLARVAYGPWQTIGGTHWTREYGLEVWVATRDDDDAGVDGDELAAALLEALAAGLPGALGSGGLRLELDGDELPQAADLGHYLWVQRYRVSDPV